ncbi:MAG: hypothetical protein H7Y60_07415 [Rhodospirillaceae bacterium]|nr:hypothetical protein [Rhodospirillales bacterium]
MMRSAVRPLAACLLPLMLGSCALFQKKEVPPCPPIYILGDAAKLTKFRPGLGRDLTDVEFEAEILGYQGGCTYDEKGALVDLQVSFALKRGPADTDHKAEFNYFAAIPYFYPSPDAKGEFPVSITFPEGTNYVRFTDEEVVMRVPVKDKDVINKYEIYLGFQETSEELERNRQDKR